MDSVMLKLQLGPNSTLDYSFEEDNYGQYGGSLGLSINNSELIYHLFQDRVRAEREPHLARVIGWCLWYISVWVSSPTVSRTPINMVQINRSTCHRMPRVWLS